MDSQDSPKTFKIVTLGDSNVGKSSLFIRYLRDEFKEAIANTIAINSEFKEVLVDGAKVHLQMWDTAGQERFRSIVSQFYRDADGFIFVYDVSMERSFGGVESLIAELGDMANPKFSVVVGNKIDCLGKEELSGRREQISEFAGKRKMKWFLTSAKTGEGVNEVFEHLSRALYYSKKVKSKPRNFVSMIKKRKRFCI